MNIITPSTLLTAAATVATARPSSDEIAYPVAGTLWEATATDEAIQGAAIPIVSNLNARARSGETYRVLFGVAAPQGVNPATLGQGQKTTGKVYFDVTDDAFYSRGCKRPPPGRRARREPRHAGGASCPRHAGDGGSPAPIA